ncbi:DUF6281 family protein [Streptomyces venezuelae]|uniref:DUF6281 family protein n=1 Tax=Streptomyces gardneri TaxID=66892 RepID=UPI0007C69570|nr:DUF6281 family protein [Streptomyces gardneri]WRK41595.1 DUF6281 family protein [Streptomyces venezuelae]
MSRPRRFSVALVAAASLVSLAACDTSSSARGEASCALQFTYNSRTYRDVANADFTVGQKLGTATKPPCDDTGTAPTDGETPTKETAYEVEGVPAEMAIAVGATPEEAMLVVVYSGTELPPEVRKLIKSP